MTKRGQVVWDLHAIKAEIGRQGLTMQAIAKQAGLEASQVRHGLRGNNRTGARAISAALGIPFRDLFRGIYVNSAAGEETTRNLELVASQNEHVRDDLARGAA